MQRAKTLRWIANVDMEALIGSALRYGMVLSMGLVTAGFVLSRIGLGHGQLEQPPQGINIFYFLLGDLPNVHSPQLWPLLLMHGGLVVLLLTPYIRVLVSLWYFACVQRHWLQTLFTGFVFATLTYILFFG